MFLSLQKTLRSLAPGTPLREGLEYILRARTGALIVVGDSRQVMELVDGGFKMDSEYTPSSLYELSKMDGAIILSQDARRIIYANVQLNPDPAIPSQETGIRHRTAERVARQTGELVIAISQRRNVVTLYKGSSKYELKDIPYILTKANQAIQTLEKYRAVLNQALSNLSALEFEDLVTVVDVATVLVRTERVLHVMKEIESYIDELGTEGRLVNMQLEELVADVEEESNLIIRDYFVPTDNLTPEEVRQQLAEGASDDLLDVVAVSRILGYGSSLTTLEHSVSPRGYRILRKIPRLPMSVIENLVQGFGNLQRILGASIEELDRVEGIGGVRARAIKDGLRRFRDQVLLDRHI